METQKKEKNKSNVIMAIILIIVAIGGGICFYFNYFAVAKDADVIEDQAIETETIAHLDGYEEFAPSDMGWIEYAEYMDKINAAMSESDATCFIVDEDYNIVKLSKDNFKVELENVDFPLSYNKTIVTASHKIENMLRMQPKSSAADPTNYTGGDNNDSVCQMGLLSSDAAVSLQNVFGADYQWNSTIIYDYFHAHKLRLEGSNVKIEKIALIKADGKTEVLLKAKGDVKTLACEGDLSDLGLYPEKGETKTLDVLYSIIPNNPEETKDYTVKWNVGYITMK